MLSVHQLWLLLVVDAGVAIAGTLVVAHFVGFRRGGLETDGGDVRNDGVASGVARDAPPAGEGAWHDEAVALAQEVRRTVASVDGATDPDRVSKRLLPLSARIRGHARRAPSAADAAVHRRLFELGMACQRVAVEGRPTDGPRGYGGLQDRLDALRSEADALQRRATAAG